MTREELLEISKQVFFETELVRSILEDRKTVTRRCVKPKSKKACGFYVTFRKSDNAFMGVYDYDENERQFDSSQPFPICPGNILYVRESGIIQSMKNLDKSVKILFPTDDSLIEFKVTPCEYERLSKFPEDKLISPYWLTKQEARIFLKVTDVRVERLQDMTLDDFLSEGVVLRPEAFNDPENAFQQAMKIYTSIWDSTIKKSDRDLYGWHANPWVWVIEFKRIFPED